MQILIDDFNGDSKEFYAFVKQEVEKREVPSATFEDGTEVRGKKGGFIGGLIAGSESAASFVVSDKIQFVKVLAYNFGKSFLVSTRTFWKDRKFAQEETEGKLLWLEEAYSGCFTETVNRAVRTALTLYMQKRQAPIPPNLDPREVFYSREARAGGEA